MTIREKWGWGELLAFWEVLHILESRRELLIWCSGFGISSVIIKYSDKGKERTFKSSSFILNVGQYSSNTWTCDGNVMTAHIYDGRMFRVRISIATRCVNIL